MALRPFESLEDFKFWWNTSARAGRECPVCECDAADCPHMGGAMQAALVAKLDDKADREKAIAEAGEGPDSSDGPTSAGFVGGDERAVRFVVAPPPKETRIVDPNTGGEKGQKLERFDLIPFDVLSALARLYGRGAQKYADDNWRKGYSWRLSVGALFRHVTKWLRGESYDTANGLKDGPCDVDASGKPVHMGEHHLICAVWHCFTLIVFDTHKLGTDDRATCTEV